MKAKTQPLIDQKLVKALGHPLRVRILTILNDRVASPNELAKETGEPLGTVSYHVRLLADLECIELMETIPRRGAVEHYYRATVRPWFNKQDWSRLPRSVRGSVSSEAVSLIAKDAAEAIKSGAFDSRDDRHVSRTPLRLDEEGWQELASELDRVLARALELKAQAADRVAKGDMSEDDLIDCDLLLFHYPTRAPDH